MQAQGSASCLERTAKASKRRQSSSSGPVTDSRRGMQPREQGSLHIMHDELSRGSLAVCQGQQKDTGQLSSRNSLEGATGR